MSAPAKEPQPMGSTSGKRGYIRTCVRCGVTLYGVTPGKILPRVPGGCQPGNGHGL